jgi:hypothetical protein
MLRQGAASSCITSLLGYSLLTVFLFAAVPEADAQTAGGTFTPAGNMTTARFLHMSTLLADGRVLIAGGQRIEAGSFPGFFRTLDSAELYDPSSRTFTPTGAMATPRTAYSGTMTLLADGKILATGGAGSDGQPVTSAELYDPNTGKFVATGNMINPRSGQTATLLNNGKVLIAGGWNGGLLATAELYDPSTGSFTATGSMSLPWADTSTLLPNGKVLITRGNPDGPAPYLSSAEIYDPATGTFASAGYLTTNHTGPTAVLLATGNVLVAGGDVGDGDGSSNIAELFNPDTGVFSATGNMTHGREQNTTTLLSDGTVLFTGSHDFVVVSVAAFAFDHLATAELYDPVTGTFRPTGSMATGRELHAATLLNDGTVLITGGDQYWPTQLGGGGGRDPVAAILASAEIYTPAVPVPALIVTDLQFDRTNTRVGSSYSANVSGPNLTPETFFDVRFIMPGSSESAVAVNWQKGIVEIHDVPAGTASGAWTINGVRAHRIETDHTGNFVPVSATITVSPN